MNFSNWRNAIMPRLVQQHEGTDYATGIRGLAALAVLSVHAGAVWPLMKISERVGFGKEITSNLNNFGSAGPAAFFITSGFVLSLVWERQSGFGYKKWILRRYLRLTPLYAFVLYYCMVSSFNLSLVDVICRLLYLDAFNEKLFLRDPIGVLWTVSLEFWLSLFVPLFVYLFRSAKRPELVLLSAFICSLIGPITLMNLGLGELMAGKSIPSGVFCFALGSYISTLKKSNESAEVFRLFMIFAFGFFLMYLWGGYMGPWWISILLTTSYLGFKRTQIADSSSTNPVLLWLGTICYGVYLLHMPVLSSLPEWAVNWAFYVSLPPVLFLASISWLLIERPGSRLFRSHTSR